MIVIDASALVELLLRTPKALWVEVRVFDSHEDIHAPHLIDVEIAHVVRRYALAGEIDAKRGDEILKDLAELPIQRWPHTPQLPRAWSLRHNLTVYDAMYVALAEFIDAPLLTADHKLASAAGHTARIELV